MTQRVRHHGTGYASGCDHLRLGSFNKLFPDLSARRSSREDAQEEAEHLGGVGGLMHDADGSSADCDLPAGYAFLAQLIDHDMMLGTKTDLNGEQLPEHKLRKLANLRSPSLDLHCLYGFGPGASPHLYDPDQPELLAAGHVDHPDDLARTRRGLALIGDPRNDENLLISQLHLLFIRFANRVYRQLQDSGAKQPFVAAQTKVRHHYQYLIVHDLLKRICAPAIFDFAFEQLKKGKYPLFYKQEGLQSFPMPVELSAAVFRFGHTLFRPTYQINEQNPDIDLLDLPRIDPKSPSVPEDLVVDWRYFFEIDPSTEPTPCKAFGLLFADSLIRRPEATSSESAASLSLACRDLLRGHILGLPDGIQVAQQLVEKKYPLDPAQNIQLHEAAGWNDIDPMVRRRTLTAPPLLLYVLREAEVQEQGQRLGAVGSAILLEVFLGILSSCKTSFLNPKWNFSLDPDIAPRTNALGERVFNMADFVRFAQGKD